MVLRTLEVPQERMAVGEVAVRFLDFRRAGQRALEGGDGPLELPESAVAEPETDPRCGVVGTERDAAPVASDGGLELVRLEVAVTEVEVDARTDHTAPVEVAQHEPRRLDGTLLEARYRLAEAVIRVVPHAPRVPPGRRVSHLRGTLPPTPEARLLACMKGW